MTAFTLVRRWWQEIAVAAIFIGVFVWILWPFIAAAWNTSAARRDLVAFTAELRLGMSQADVRARFSSAPREFLSLNEIDTTLTLVNTPRRIGADDWIAWLDFTDGRLSSVRIRIADSRAIKPGDSPPDVGAPPPTRP
jgi:hypothetical protein